MTRDCPTLTFRTIDSFVAVYAVALSQVAGPV